MAVYIEKQAAIDAIPKPQVCEYMDEFGAGRNSCAYDAEKAIEAIPAADVVPVEHARWENYSPVTIKCSRCGHVIHDWRYSECKYCPNCGAKMDGGESDG